MIWIILSAVAVLCIVGLLLISLRRSTGRRSPRREALTPATNLRLKPRGYASANAEPEGTVIVRILDGNRALVFGHDEDFDDFGTTMSTLTDTIAAGLTRGNAALQAALGAGEVSGRIVMLTAESAAQLKALGPVKDATGATLGVVRNADGKWANVLRFRKAEKVASAASLGPALSAIALQMQLAAISKKLDGVQQSVDRIEEHQNDSLAASIESTFATALRHYERFQLTGAISADDWQEITTWLNDAETNARQLARKVDRLLNDLDAVKGSGDRRARDRNEGLAKLDKSRPTATLYLYMRAQQVVVLGEMLRVNRRGTTSDPNLELHRQESEQRVHEVLGESYDLLNRWDQALSTAGSGHITEPWYSMPAWFADREKELATRLERLRQLSGPFVDVARDSAVSIGARTLLPIEGGGSADEPDA